MKTATSTWNAGTEFFSGEQSKERNYVQEENLSSKEVLSINESSWNPNTNSSLSVDSRETQSNKRFKLLEVNNISLYWDNDAIFLLSQFDIFKYREKFQSSLTPLKINERISAAMKKMMSTTDPGEEIRHSLSISSFNASNQSYSKIVTPKIDFITLYNHQ
mmetsp:Transcript_53395/g.53802  ORF Transcript_53395/g.53802 Transcript_53395/m.53802 type:complete len:161 (-) Transcript_53395:113-595(-)